MWFKPVRRRKFPTRVKRISAPLDECWKAIVRKRNKVNCRPSALVRVYRTNTGPGDVNLMAAMITRKFGAKMASRREEPAASKMRLRPSLPQTCAIPPAALSKLIAKINLLISPGISWACLSHSSEYLSWRSLGRRDIAIFIIISVRRGSHAFASSYANNPATVIARADKTRTIAMPVLLFLAIDRGMFPALMYSRRPSSCTVDALASWPPMALSFPIRFEASQPSPT